MLVRKRRRKQKQNKKNHSSKKNHDSVLKGSVTDTVSIEISLDDAQKIKTIIKYHKTQL